MGRLLERLLADSQSLPTATPATLATIHPAHPEKVAESQESQRVAIEKRQEQRAHLLKLVVGETLPVGLVHGLDDADVDACDGLPDATLVAYLRALHDGQRMDAGMVPSSWGEAMARACEGCGPVLLWPTCPAMVKACPWCFRRKAGKAIPRPLVACGDCRHYLPDPVNPAAGAGACGLAAGRSHWPMQEHRCGDWRRRDE